VPGLAAIVAALRLVHPAPAATVIALSAVLGAILLAQSGRPLDWRLVLTTLAVAGSQVLTGALNDWSDRDRDRLAQPTKPIPSGAVARGAAIGVAGAGALLQLGASIPLGALPLLLGAIASASAVAYNLWLSRTPASVVPYLVSFGLLPLWVASGVGVELARVAAAPILVGPFAAAAHLANTVRDFEVDARLGSRNLAQVLGRRVALNLAWGLAMTVGTTVGAVMALAGDAPDAPALVLGLIGLAAVAQGIGGPRRLWFGIMVAALCWTAAWGLATG
jgi:4-hydroxybenzoate polyprenyltransferase